jgi:hypothetical protein
VNLPNVTSFFLPPFSLESLNLPNFGFFFSSSSQNQVQMVAMDYMDQFKDLSNLGVSSSPHTLGVYNFIGTRVNSKVDFSSLLRKETIIYPCNY